MCYIDLVMWDISSNGLNIIRFAVYLLCGAHCGYWITN